MIVACIAAYNEENTIAKIVLLTKRYVDKVIVCDDGSNDMTREIAALNADIVSHDKNMGKGSALRTLFSKAFELNPDIVVTLDADGQHDPTEIPKLIKPIIEGKAEVVIGSRFVKGSVSDIPLYRKFGLTFMNWLGRKASNIQAKDTQSGFRAYSLKALKIVSSFESKGYGVESEQLAVATKHGLTIMEVPINVKYGGLTKTSKKDPLPHGWELVSSILRLVIEEKPLFFLGIPGIGCFIIGVFFGVQLLQLYAQRQYIVTNVALASMAFIFIGLFAISTAITLYALRRLAQKLNNK